MNRLFGGLDTDTAPHLIENGSVLNSVNMRAIVSKAQKTTDAQFIEGNTEITAINSVIGLGTHRLLGDCVESDGGNIYLFIYTSAGMNTGGKIVRYNINTGTATLIIDDSYLTNGLGWATSTRIDSRATIDYLFWTDGSEPKYLDLNFDYAAIWPADNTVINLITLPPVVPVTADRDRDNTISTNIQFEPLQITYRFVNSAGFTSVLAPCSTTLLPVRESEVSLSVNSGNVIDVDVPLAQKIPANWKQVELVARYTEGNTFFVIKQWSRDSAADVTAVNDHNSGSANLSYRWNGDTIYAIDQAAAAKQFDSVPHEAHHLELAANRLLLANITEGYDTPSEVPTYTTTLNDYSISEPTRTTVQSYLIACKTSQGDWYIAIFARIDDKNYLLPKDFSIGHINESQGIVHILDYGTNVRAQMLVLDDEIWAVPQVIARSALIELKEQGDPGTGNPSANSDEQNIRYNIVAEANDVDFKIAAEPDRNIMTYKEFDVVNDAYEFGGSGDKSRAFLPNSTYKFGLQYYDQYMRKSGVQNLGSVTIPKYGPYTRELIGTIDLELTNSNGIPDWAHYYSIVMSKQQKSQRFIQYVADTIKVALIDRDGNYKFSGNQCFAYPPAGYTIAGIAVPLLPLARYNYGYEYTQGDYIELVGLASSGTDDSVVIKGYVKTVVNGYAIITVPMGLSADFDYIIPQSSKYIFSTGEVALTSPPYSVAWDAEHMEPVMSSDIQTTTPPYPPVASNIATKRQFTVIVTIYNAIPADAELYEVARFGPINNPGNNPTFGNFYTSGSLTATFNGDTYTQQRMGDAGSLTCVSMTTYEQRQTIIPITDLGRICAIDRIGQNSLPTAIRWSNTNIPGAVTSGYATFDALNYRILEETAGEVTFLVMTTKGIQDGGQLLILCSNNTFVTLVGKQQIYSADSSSAFVVSTADVMGDINPLKGGWTCQSPRAVVSYQGKIWWPDMKNREIVEFSDGGANAVSRYKAARLWSRVLSEVTNPYSLTAGVNPYADEYLISVPAFVGSKDNLPTTDLPDPFDAYYPSTRSYLYNWELNRWVGSWEHGGKFINVGDRVFSFQNNKLWEEFTGSPGVYCGTTRKGIMAVSFNDGYPNVKSPKAIIIDSNTIPNAVWLKTDAKEFGVQVAQTAPFTIKEGDVEASVLRNRLSNNASNSSEYDHSGHFGERLKGKAILVAIIWDGAETYTSGVTLITRESSGRQNTK